MKILLVEDDESVRRAFVRLCNARFETKPTILQAGTLEQGLELFTQNKTDLDMIIMDACVNNPRVVDSPDLIRSMRSAGFGGPIIANSSNAENNELLLAAGASRAFLKIDPS